MMVTLEVLSDLLALNAKVQVGVYVTIVVVKVLPFKVAPTILCYVSVFFALVHVL